MKIKKDNLPDSVKKMPKEMQELWFSSYKKAIEEKKSEEEAMKYATLACKDKDKKLDENESYAFMVSLSEDSSEIEIMRVGKWEHPEYGTISINEEKMEGFIRSFNDNVRGVDLAIDLEHGITEKKGAAAGWIKNLVRNGSKLFATIEWTELGKKALKEGLYRYFSPEFKFVYQDKESGKIFKNVLLGGALTNRPFIKNMQAVLLSEENEYKKNKEEGSKMNEELLKALGLSENATQEDVDKAMLAKLEESKKLSENEKELDKVKADLEEKNKEIKKLTETNKTLSDSVGSSTSEVVKLSEQVKEISNKLTETEWEQTKTKLMSEGKLTKAMADKFKALYFSDRKTAESIFETLPVSVELDETGTSKGKGEAAEKTNEEKIDEFIAKKLTEKDNKLNYVEAAALAEKELGITLL